MLLRKRTIFLYGTRDSNLLWDGKRINPRTRIAVRRTDPEHLPFSEQANLSVVGAGVIIMQINVEGLTKAKYAIVKHLMEKHKATAILWQETHSLDISKLKNSSYNHAVCNNSSADGTATFVKNSASWTPISSSKTDTEVEWMATEIEGITVVNMYKPPNIKLQSNSILDFASPCIYAGDFNSHSTTWSYQSINPDGKTLESLASAAGLQLFYDPKQSDSFHFERWNSTANPYMVFANISLTPERLVLTPFPKSKHRPSLISPVNPISPISRKAVK